MKYSILCMLPFLVLIISCNRDDFQNVTKKEINLSDKEYIKNASKSEQLVYKEYYLKQALLEITQHKIDIKNIAFDTKRKGTKNVILLSEIFSEIRKNDKNLTKRTEDKFNEIEDAFNGLDGHNYEISFYIPFDYLLDKSLAKGITSQMEPENIYIFEKEEISEQVSFEGVILNEDGEFVSYEHLITEEMAEDFAEAGKAVIIVGLQEESFINPEVATSTQMSSYNPYFNMLDMAIKQHKESWIGGRSEITFDGNMIAGGYVGGINLASWNYFTQYQFWTPSRKQVRDQQMFSVNRTLGYIFTENPNAQFYTPVLQDDYALNSLIYEYDNWPTGNRSVTFNYKGTSVNILYRSADPPYDYRSFIGHNVPQSFIENEGIKYRLSYGSKNLTYPY